MSLHVKISSEINENEWNEDLSKSTGSTVYQTYNWQKTNKHGKLKAKK